MKAGTIIQWVFLITVGVLIYLAVHNHWVVEIKHYDLTVIEVVVFGFVFAFTFTKGRTWATKPFSCTPCMTGWFTLALGIYTFGAIGWVFLPVGYFVGAIADRIIRRYL